MAEITAGLVKDLRERTGLGMMECKRALAEVGGDLTKAEDLLRVRSGACLHRGRHGGRRRALGTPQQGICCRRRSRAGCHPAKERPWLGASRLCGLADLAQSRGFSGASPATAPVAMTVVGRACPSADSGTDTRRADVTETNPRTRGM